MEGCTRGGVAGWVYREGVYRVLTQPARLRLIDLKLRLIGSYGRLTENLRIFLDLRYWDLGPGSGSWIWDLDLGPGVWIWDLDLDPETGPEIDPKNLISNIYRF